MRTRARGGDPARDPRSINPSRAPNALPPWLRLRLRRQAGFFDHILEVPARQIGERLRLMRPALAQLVEIIPRPFACGGRAVPWTMHHVARLKVFLILRLLEGQILG